MPSEPVLTFAFGLLLLILFGWYFATEFPSRKRWLGLTLTILLTGFCAQQAWPPFNIKNGDGKVVVPGKVRLGLDLKGGTSFQLTLVPQPGSESTISRRALEQAVEVIRKRVDQYGLSEPIISPQGDNGISVQIPGLDTQQIPEVEANLKRVAHLEFAMVAPVSQEQIARIEKGEEVLDPSYVLKPYKINNNGKDETVQILVKRRAALDGEHVTKAWPFYDQQGAGVSVQLDKVGADIFDQVAAQNKGRQMAILLDGEVLSAPVLQSDHFGGHCQITGNFSQQAAINLASALENPLRQSVKVEEIRSVSATLGEDSIRSGVLSGVTGLLLVMAFVVIYYRFAGVIAFIGLLINMVILFGVMVMLNFTLTLPGIAGIMLTMGLAVDANVLIYERLREELAAGKSLPAAISGAYDKAFSAIFDANATTLITAVILFWQATGSVKGFAITLTLGIIASMFSALLVTRTIFRWLIEKNKIAKVTMMDISPKKTFDFLGKRRAAAIFSVLLIVGSFVIFGIRGANNFGIDFRGGDLLTVGYSKPITLTEARNVINDPNVVIQFDHQGTTETLTIRSAKDTSMGIFEKLKKAFPDNGIKQIGQSTVGAQIGMEFAKKSFFALGLGILAILVYVTLRFEFSFALGAVVALVHDVVITIGAFSLIGGELSLVMVGAILTIAGYSINDTIVVYDRIREGLKNGASGSIQTLMNNSINEMLGRTFLTGGTTFLSVASLFFLGGAVLRDFSFAILIGIVVGTYSSIYIAAPIVLWSSKARGKSVRREVLGDAETKSA